jgi:hypothetical protein
MYFLYKYEHGTLKLEVTIRRGKGRRENNGGDEPIPGPIHVYMEVSK